MESFLKALKDHEVNYYVTRAFELEVTNFVKSHTFSKDEITILSKHLGNDSVDAFLSFFILFTYHRRHLHMKDLVQLYEDHYNQLDKVGYPILSHLQYLYLSTTQKDKITLINLISKIKQSLNLPVFKHHIGMMHHYCELVALVGEIDDDFKRLNKSDIEYAYQLIEEIINEEPYPKFYLTKARLELLLGKYDLAIANIDLSIQQEDTAHHDYIITINKLNDYKLRANLLKIKHEQKEELEAFKKTSDDIKKNLVNTTKKMEANNVKIIALFSSLMSLVIGNVTLAASPSANPMNLMLAFTGSVFILLGIILAVISVLGYQKDLSKSQKVFLVGTVILTILVGILMMIIASRRG